MNASGGRRRHALGRGLRRVRAVGAAAALLVTLSLVQAVAVAPAASAQTTPVDYRALEQQIAQAVNEARINPDQMAATLGSLKDSPDGPYNVLLPDGSRVSTQLPDLVQAAEEAKTQPPLPPLAWSEQLADLGRQWTGRAWKEQHGNYAARTQRAGITTTTIEAITAADPNPNSFVYTFWISSGEWSRSSAWDPSAYSGRGHRAIVNDSRMTAIGVGCGPHRNSYDPSRVQAICVLNDGINPSDQSPVATPPGGAPSLAALPTPVGGSVGTTTDPEQSALIVDTSVAATPTSTSEETFSPSVGDLVTTDGGGRSPSTTPSESATAGQAGDLAFGEAWDVNGDGSFLITVTAQDQFTPSDRATVTNGTATSYRGYEIRYQNNSDTSYSLPDIVKQWSCTSGTDQLPFVLDPPGQGLPAPGQLGRGAAIFAFGCGTGANGYAEVGALLGDELGGGSRFWVQK